MKNYTFLVLYVITAGYSQNIVREADFVLIGDYYTGAIADGKREGFGIYTYPNGDVYEGEWENDRKNGKGIFISVKQKINYSGVFKNDKYHGHGSLKIKNSIISSNSQIVSNDDSGEEKIFLLGEGTKIYL